MFEKEAFAYLFPTLHYIKITPLVFFASFLNIQINIQLISQPIQPTQQSN